MSLSKYISRISYSNIQTFSQCKFKWKLRYIDNIQIDSPAIQLIFGTAMHQTIQQFLKKYYSEYTLQFIRDNKSTLIDQYSQLMIDRLTSILAEKQETNTSFNITYQVLQQHLQYAINLLTELIPHASKWFPKKNTELVAVQYELSYKLENSQLGFIGYIDVLIRDKKTNRYTIYDLKTSRFGWKQKQKKDEGKRLQLQLYKYFLSNKLNIDLNDIDIKFLILKKLIYQKSEFKISRLQQYIPPSSHVTIKKVVQLFNNTIRQMQDISNDIEKQVPKTVSKLCQYCPYMKAVNNEGQLLCNRNRDLRKLKK